VDILLMLIPMALGLGLLGLLAFLWALRSGQFDDLDGAAERILFDEEAPTGRKSGWESSPDLAKPPGGSAQAEDPGHEQRSQKPPNFHP